MRIDQKQARYLGIALIVLGVFAVFNLWWLLPTLVLGAAGVYVYTQRRQMGRIGEAIQGGLWLLGLALLVLVGWIFPGVLLLAGVSLLLRGREHDIDNRVQRLVTRFQNRRYGARVPSTSTSQNVPVQTPPANSEREEQPSTSETIRL